MLGLESVSVGVGVNNEQCRVIFRVKLMTNFFFTAFSQTLVDADYRGPVGVVLFNFGTEDFEIKKGDRIAQLILEKVEMANVEQVEELEDTLRGQGGFGSTGVDKELPVGKKQRTISPSNSNDGATPVDPPAAESK